MSRHSSRGKEWERIRQVVLANFGYQCIGMYPAICEVDQHLSVDHIIAKNNGGTDDIENLQVLCRRCNSKKQDKEQSVQKSWFSKKYFPAGPVRRPGH